MCRNPEFNSWKSEMEYLKDGAVGMHTDEMPWSEISYFWWQHRNLKLQ